MAKCYLEFDGFDSFLTKALKKIFEANAFPDVTLVGDDNFPIEAHRIILSAHSSIFENAIIECKSAKPTLHCKGFTYPDLHSLLSYLYLGQVSVPFAQASELLKIAKYLKISQLGQECNVTDIELNKMFSVITSDEDGNIVEKTNDVQDVDRYVASLQSAEVLRFNDIHNETTTFPDEDLETCQSVYESFEEPVDLESINVDNSREENEKTSSGKRDTPQKRVKQKRSGWFKKQRELMPILDKQKFDDEELTNYGAEMVGKPLPNYSALRSVTYSHYYFVKLKPVDDITWARCNLCWYKIGQILPNGKSMYVKVSDQVNKGSTASLLSHIINRHPDMVEKFVEQHAQANKLRQMMRESLKLKQQEQKIKRMEEKREIKKNKKIDKDKNSELKQKQKRIERIKKYAEKSPEYDFEHIDEDILTIAVGEPTDNYYPSEAIVFSHNYFRRLYPIEARRNWKEKTSSLYAECITCAQRNDRVILSTPGASNTLLNHHIKRRHPDLVLQFLNQQEAKKEENLQAKERWKQYKLNSKNSKKIKKFDSPTQKFGSPTQN